MNNTHIVLIITIISIIIIIYFMNIRENFDRIGSKKNCIIYDNINQCMNMCQKNKCCSGFVTDGNKCCILSSKIIITH